MFELHQHIVTVAPQSYGHLMETTDAWTELLDEAHEILKSDQHLYEAAAAVLQSRFSHLPLDALAELFDDYVDTMIELQEEERTDRASMQRRFHYIETFL